jgi:hypothetical protein
MRLLGLCKQKSTITNSQLALMKTVIIIFKSTQAPNARKHLTFRDNTASEMAKQQKSYQALIFF